MTVQEFKERHPDIARLEGNDLWDAMKRSMIVPYTPKFGDHEIAEVFECGGYTFHITVGVKRMLDEFSKPFPYSGMMSNKYFI